MWNKYSILIGRGCCNKNMLVVLVLAILIIPLITGITLISYYAKQTKDVYMYTSADESYKIYDSTAVTFVRWVCMHKTEVDNITWVMYTSDCDTSNTTDNNPVRTYPIVPKNPITSKKGYFFYFSDSSSIDYHPNQTGSEAKYQFTRSESKARNLVCCSFSLL